MATWVSAVVTLAAVIVALWSAHKAGAVAAAVRQSERQVELQNEARLRAQLSVVIDQELYMMVGSMEFVSQKAAYALERNWLTEAEQVLRELTPREGLVLLERFSSDLVVFSPEIGAKLLNILGTMIAIRHSPAPEFSDSENAQAGISKFIETIEGMTQNMRDARARIRQFVPPPIQLPPLN